MSLPPVPPIEDAARYQRYVVTQATRDFDVTFPVFGDATDLRVVVDGVQLDPSGYEFLSYSGQLSFLPLPIEDGYVRLPTPVVGVTIDIYGNHRPRRTVQATAPFSTRDFNVVFSYVIATMRELFDRAVAAVRVPGGEPDITIPASADRANKYLAFDADGKPVAATGTGSVIVNVTSNDISDATTIGKALLTAAGSQDVVDQIPTFDVGADGLVPSPTSGDVAAVRLLAANKQWVDPPVGGGGGTLIPPGARMEFLLSTAPAGWVALDGGTIGNGSSGATTRANADTAALFAVLWDLSALDAPIFIADGSPTSRGASAAADFAAGRRIQLPDDGGIFPRGWHAGQTVDADRRLGSFQEQDVQPHVHSLPFSVINNRNTQSGGNERVVLFPGSSFNSNPSGGVETRPKNRAYLVCVKL